MQTDEKYDGILVCVAKDPDHPLIPHIEAVDDNCRCCGCDIMHQPLDKVEMKLLPLCERCGITMAMLEDKDPEVIGLPGAEDKFDEVMGNGTSKAALDVMKKTLYEMRAAIRE